MDIQSLFGLQGRVALVTGGSRGIGKMFVEGLLAAGCARVYISARKVEQMEETIAALGADKVIGIPADLSQMDGMIALANRSEGYTEEMVALLEPLAQMLGALIKARADEDARSKAAALWREQATVDSLTGLANRRRFFDLVARHIPQVRRYGGQATIVLMDLDHFKQINDTHGHASGDLVLKAFGKLLAASVRDTDLAARIGGEEFAIFMPSTSPHDALIALERIRQRWAAQPTECEGCSVAATVSIGVAGWGPGSDSPEQWLAQADEALYQAKRDGRNCIRVAG